MLNREIGFGSFRSCVRACVRARRGEAVWAREAMCLPTLGDFSFKSAPVRSAFRDVRRVPFFSK